MRYTHFLLISLFLHLCIITWLPTKHTTKYDVKHSTSKGSNRVVFISKNVSSSKNTCKGSSYEGIGIILSPTSNTIIEVARGYSADRVGMLVGDTVLGYYDNKESSLLLTDVNFAGRIGENFGVLIDRRGSRIKFRVIVEEICRSEI